LKKIRNIFLILLLTSCSSSSDGECPKNKAPTSNLEIEPIAEAAVQIHPNGKDTTWNWQLTETLDTTYNVNVYDVDLFDTSEDTIASLHADGRKIICYFSAGSSENFRDDFLDFKEEDIGKPLEGWAGEKWLDIRSQNILDIMEARLDLAQSKGCDGVEPDNMDGYQQDTCFDLTENDQLAYNRAIANLARERGLSVALKNTPDLIPELVDYFDFSVSEQCYFYEECSKYLPFTNQNKPVFNAEYDETYRIDPDQAELCTYSNSHELQTLVLALDLDNTYRYSCF
jgi:hypothetical protein